MNQDEESGNQLGQLEAVRQEYLSLWNSTAFSSQFDVFIAEGTDGGYGVYREHIPANVFRAGETIVLLFRASRVWPSGNYSHEH